MSSAIMSVAFTVSGLFLFALVSFSWRWRTVSRKWLSNSTQPVPNRWHWLQWHPSGTSGNRFQVTTALVARVARVARVALARSSFPRPVISVSSTGAASGERQEGRRGGGAEGLGTAPAPSRRVENAGEAKRDGKGLETERERPVENSLGAHQHWLRAPSGKRKPFQVSIHPLGPIPGRIYIPEMRGIVDILRDSRGSFGWHEPKANDSRLIGNFHECTERPDWPRLAGAHFNMKALIGRHRPAS